MDGVRITARTSVSAPRASVSDGFSRLQQCGTFMSTNLVIIYRVHFNTLSMNRPQSEAGQPFITKSRQKITDDDSMVIFTFKKLYLL